MKAFLNKIYINEEINKKLQELKIDLTTSVEDCDCIIYDCPIEEVFETSYNASQVKTIISKDEMLSISSLEPTSVIEKSSHSLVFENENVSEVSSKIKESVKGIVDASFFADHDRFMSLVAIELVQNALIYQKETNSQEKIQLTLTEGEENYSIAVTDPFGGLSHEMILNKIQRAYKDRTPENKATGAGLGFSMILSASDELIVKSELNKRTTVCLIMNEYKRLKEYKRKSPTLYLRQGV